MLPLIPLPERVERHPGQFDLSGPHRILLVPDEPPVRQAAQRLAHLITGNTTTSIVTSNPAAPGDIIMERVADAAPDSYTLEIAPDRVHVKALDAAGFLAAVHTLAQLFDGARAGAHAPGSADVLPAVTIVDRPRFAWRGLGVDVARHFRSAAWMRRLVDQMARLKLNVLHWHLTDDQGWRIPIARLPQLIVAAGTRHGGAYTTEEIEELVAYGTSVGVSVIPEITVPGHVSGALAAYPDLSCRAAPVGVAPVWGTFDDVMCPGSESPFVFVDACVDELVKRFPGQFIHLGGNDVPRTRWIDCARCKARMNTEHLTSPGQLQAYFLSRATTSLSRHGRRPIVWDDDRAHGFPPGTVVQVRHGDAALTEVLSAGHDAVASPEATLFFDRPAIATPLARVLAYDPVPAAAGAAAARHVLGAEAYLSTERIRDEATAERALFPRLLAFAESVWSPPGPRDPAAFSKRAAPAIARLAAAGCAVGESGTRVAMLTPRQLAGDWRLVKIDVTQNIDGPGVYALALGEDTPEPVDVLSVRLERDGETQVQIQRQTSTHREVRERTYELELKLRPPGGRWTLEMVIRCQSPRAAVAAVWLEKRPLVY